MRGLNISNYGLKSEIKLIERQINTIEDQIRELLDKVKIKEVLDKDKIVQLETQKKRLTDAIKMACYRTETQMYETVGHHVLHWKAPDVRRSEITDSISSWQFHEISELKAAWDHSYLIKILNK